MIKTVKIMSKVSNLGHLPPLVRQSVIDFIGDAKDFSVHAYSNCSLGLPDLASGCNAVKIISTPGKVYRVTKTTKEGV